MKKSGIDLVDRVYFILVNAGIPDLVTGEIIKGGYNPINEPYDEFITINTLPLQNSDLIGSGGLNINLFIVDKDGNVDISRFRSIYPTILEKLEEYEENKGLLTVKKRDKENNYSDVVVDMTKEYFSITVKFVHGPFKDERENAVFKNHSKFNIRVSCNIENL